MPGLSERHAEVRLWAADVDVREPEMLLGGTEAFMNAIPMMLKCRAGQKIMGDYSDEPGGGPITPGPFTDDHGDMPFRLAPTSESVMEGP